MNCITNLENNICAKNSMNIIKKLIESYPTKDEKELT